VTIVDTNVVSEIVKPEPSVAVLAWMKMQPSSALYMTATTLAEVLYGVEVVPDGKRRAKLQAAIEGAFEARFSKRILSFDEDAARAFALIMAHCSRIGKPIEDFDAQIAAIAKSRGASIATRNTRHFANCGILLINPWNYSN
jgi:predicted nucleic acid-binding protein